MCEPTRVSMLITLLKIVVMAASVFNVQTTEAANSHYGGAPLGANWKVLFFRGFLTTSCAISYNVSRDAEQYAI